MQTEKFQLESEQIMPETRLTELPALSVDPRVGIFLGLRRRPMFAYFFLPMKLKVLFIVLIVFIFDILRCITTFSGRYSVLF